jgi:hypothetical protein
LGADVTAFLDRALVEVVPDRDVPAAKAICTRICQMWPTDDAGWEAALEVLAEEMAAHLADRPELWGRALHLTALYLNRAEFDEPHPRQDARDLPVFRSGVRVYFVELGLARAFARALLVRAGEGRRDRLFESLDEWRAWEAAAGALAQLRPRLDASEIARILTLAVRFTIGDSAAEDVLDPIREALLSASTAGVDEILERWTSGEEPHADVDARVVGLLALWRLPGRDDGESLRRRVVRQLSRLPPQRGARIALQVAFRSWPADAALSQRADLLLETLGRLGNMATSAALAVLAHDPNTDPLAALPILDAIVERIDEADEDTAVERTRVLRWIAEASSDASQLLARLPKPEQFSERSMPWLDRALSVLARRAEEAVRAYVLDWIEVHPDHLEHLRKTRVRLSGDDWLIEAAVSPRPSLRRGAVRSLVGSKPDSESRRAAFERLDAQQALGLAHVILSQASAGTKIVDLLFELAQARTHDLEVLSPLLGEPTMQTYPGRHRQCVEAWATAIAGRPDDDPQKLVVARLTALLDARRRKNEGRRALRWMLFERTQPTRAPMNELLSRQMRAAMDQHESALLALTTKVPIACGEATTWENGDGDTRKPQPLEEKWYEMEGLLLDAYDPIAAQLARVDHEQQARRLLGGP